MTAIHEPGEVWHVGWDWHADMWYVEPPFDVDQDEPMAWYTERHQAFEHVDKWLRERPVENSIVDEVEPFDSSNIVSNVPIDIPRYVPVRETAEPTRVVSDRVQIPTLEEAQTAQEQRLAEYNARVGIK